MNDFRIFCSRLAMFLLPAGLFVAYPETAVAGVDFSQVDLFFPMMLALTPFGIFLTLVALGIRRISTRFRAFAHVLFMVSLAILLVYIFAFIREGVFTRSRSLVGMAMAPVIINIILVPVYFFTSHENRRIQWLSLGTLGLIGGLVFAFSLYMTLGTSSAKSSHTPRVSTIIPTPVATDRKRSFTLPPRPASPEVLFRSLPEGVDLSAKKKKLGEKQK